MKKILIMVFALAILFSFSTVCLALEEGAEAQNVLEMAYGWICEHATELFSAMTLIGSVILSVSYKRGLLPTLSGALGRISASVKSFGDNADLAFGRLDGLSERFTATEGLCERLSDELSELSARLAEGEAERSEREKMKIILSSQVDMLYDIFISSGLPQYAKEAVGERVKEMRAMLSEVEEND